MWLLQPVLVPFALAIFFSQCLQPFIDFLMVRFRWPQMVAVTIAALGGAAVITGIGFLLASSMSGMNVYADRFQALGQSLMDSRPAHLLGIKPGAASDAIRTLLPSDVLANIASQARTIVSNTVTVMILMAFLLFGRRSQKRSRGILGEIEERVQRYISLTFVISVLTGVSVGITLRVLGVQFAAGFGFLAFLLNFIPNLGAVVATLLPLPFVFLDPQLSIVAKIAALAIPGLIQAGVGSFIQPRWMGNSLNLHPVVLLLSLIFFALIWGIAGAFLATPLTAVIKIVLEKIPATRPLAAALAGNLDPLAETIDPPADVVGSSGPREAA
jgi:AI-2 transport protein TqsA